MFSAYLCLEQLPDQVKAQHHIKTGGAVPRFDLTKMAGSLPGLDALTNKKGMVVMFLQRTMGIINASDGRRADCFLMAKNSLNFSSLYLLNRSNERAHYVGFGNPMSSATYGKDNKPNPFYQSRGDGYLFLIPEDWKQIEVFIIPHGKFTVIGEATMMQKNMLDEAIQSIRQHACTFYPYGADLPKLW